MKWMNLAGSIHFHALKHTFFTVRQKCAAVFFEERSGSIDITGCDRKSEHICLRDDQNLSLIERGENKKVAAFQHRHRITHGFKKYDVPSGFQASGKTAKAFVQVTHSANDDKPCLWMAVPEGVKGTDQAFLTFLRGVSSGVS